MEDNGKRKASQSPGEDNRSSFLGNAKTRKVNPSEESQCNVSQILTHDGPRGSDLTQKLVSMWLGGSKSHDSLLTREVRESIAVLESQQKCADAENLIQKIQQKVQNAETKIAALTMELELEKSTSRDLIEKINATAEMVSTIKEHINYAADTLERCQHHKDHLSNLYDNIMLRQRRKVNELRNRENSFKQQILDLQKEESLIKKNLTDTQMSCENKLHEKDSKLAILDTKYKLLLRQMQNATEEKEEILQALSIKENVNLEYQQKISAYETEIKNISNKLAEVSATLDTINEEKSQLKNDLMIKSSETLKLVEDLESIKNQNDSEIFSMKNKNEELEKKLSSEYYEREKLVKMLNETTDQKNDLTGQVEKLRNETSEGMKELIKKLEHCEMEKQRIRDENKKIIDEVEKKNEFANADISRLEDEINSLKREKEERKAELQVVEDLLMKHANSELQLKHKLEQYKSEAAGLALSVATPAEYKKTEDAQNKGNLKKINELEQELLKMKFDRAKAIEPEVKQSKVNEDSVILSQRNVPVKRKTEAATAYQKSILKRSVKPRRTRSSPSSPSAPSNKKISFMDLDSSDASPVKLTSATDSNPFPNSEDLFDKIAGTGNSFSQSLPVSQTNFQTLSGTPTGGKKFFKSRNSQPK